MNARSIWPKIFIMLALGGGLTLSNPGTAKASEQAKVSPSIAQVVKLHESGVGAEVLLAFVKETPISKPSAEEVLYLTEKGIPKEVVVALLSKRVWADMAPAQSQPAQAQTALPPAVTASQPATQTVVYVQQPAPVTYVSPPPMYYDYAPRYYYDPWPAFSVGIGFGHYWHHGGHWGHRHGHHHHGGGIRVHRR